jgi:diacylglycerol kinase
MNVKGKQSSSRIRSFANAFHGLIIVFRSHANFRIQLGIAFIAIILSIWLAISRTEWGIIILLIGLVLSLETINTSIEILCDKVDSNYSESIKKVKDIAAASVLISSVAAAIIACIIFIPKIFLLLNLV